MPETNVVALRPHADVLWVAVQPRSLDDSCSDAVVEAVNAAATQDPQKPVVLDLDKVEFVASPGLGALVVLSRRFRQEGRRCILIGLQAQVRSVLALTRLDKLFEI